MALPTQLQEQVDKAKAIAEQLYGEKTDENPTPAGEASSQENTDAAASEAAAAAPAAQSATPAVATPVDQTATSTPEENNDTYAQRWRSLQGVYNAQKRQLDDTQQRLANMEQLVAQMQAAPAANAPAQAKRSQHVTDKDVTEYGADMVEFARRVSREEIVPLAQAVQQMMQRIDQLQGVVPTVRQIADTQAKTAHEKFYDALTGRVADWKKINDNPRFHEWLMSADPLSGLQRQTLLTDAHSNLNVDRTVSIFDTWKREAGIADAPANDAAQSAAKASNISKLEKQVAPGRASSGTTPPAQQQKKQWSRGEIAQFFADKMAGRYKGREAEARSLESDIFLAQREGRVALNAA
jgi:hypothetical protein